MYCVFYNKQLFASFSSKEDAVRLALAVNSSSNVVHKILVSGPDDSELITFVFTPKKDA